MGKHLPPPSPREEATIGAGAHSTPLWLRRAALVVGLVLVGLGSAIAGFSVYRHENPIQMVAETFVPSPQQVFGKPSILVLVEGLDYDYTANDIEFSKNSRSDIIKAVNLEFDPKGVYVLSVLRDMLATYPNGAQMKINQAQADGGVKEAQQVIGSFLGVPGFDRYVILRADATKDLINAIGGVDVFVKTSDCLEYKTGCTGGRIDYDDNWGHLHIHLKEGMQHLDGAQAVGYGRFRHDWCSDPCRVKRQNQVIEAAINKLKGDKLNTLVHAGDLLNVLHKDVQTNFTDGELATLASYFSGISVADVHFATTPYTGDEVLADGDDLIPDKTKIAGMVQNMLIAPPTPEPSPDAMALAAVAPQSIRVDVENASGVDGAAKAVADALRKAGYQIGTIGNAPSDAASKTVIQEHSNVLFAGAKVRSSLPLVVQNVPITGSPVPSGAPASGSPAQSDVTLFVGRDLATAALAKTAAPSSGPQ